ncbi:oxidoreductase [Nocardioides albidus]|uniref:Oxidoreductase n=1 Tax=Nocardioides albidus TaxID=1517589 RepID=A0A5C4VJS0_9ACTN|nr:PDR/VanB family oxidoreductase [Nocardioides albidus]TNM36183.1 oxidoreductase [Nocardioides albidus]
MTAPTDEQELELLVKQMTLEADGVLSLRLTHPAGEELPAWTPGAHVDLTLKNSLVRQYSLCGDPADRHSYRVAVLREQAALGGSEYVHEGLRPGHRLRVIGPRNNFDFLPAKRYVFVAGGIGITPLLAMLTEAERRGADWELWYGGRRQESMAFLDELASYGDRVHVIPEDISGRLDLAAALPAHEPDTLVYCCGPEPLLAAVEEHTASWPAGALQVERFKAKQVEIDPDGEQAIQVECRRSGQTVEVPADVSILDALESAGISVSSSCRDGICGTCETKVLAGTPEHRDSLLSPSEQESGATMMICVSRARTSQLALDV